jgi:hypothetical protein
LNKKVLSGAQLFQQEGRSKQLEDERTKQGIGLKTQIAYVLAIADRETA